MISKAVSKMVTMSIKKVVKFDTHETLIRIGKDLDVVVVKHLFRNLISIEFLTRISIKCIFSGLG